MRSTCLAQDLCNKNRVDEQVKNVKNSFLIKDKVYFGFKTRVLKFWTMSVTDFERQPLKTIQQTFNSIKFNK